MNRKFKSNIYKIVTEMFSSSDAQSTGNDDICVHSFQ